MAKLGAALEARYIAPSHWGSYEVTSAATDHYNCIAWAAQSDDEWIWPGPEPFQRWPSEVPREATLDAFIAFFERLGFERFSGAEFDQSYEFVAIWTDDDGPSHAARSLPDGSWTSKLGSSEDISHLALEALQGYGVVGAVLRRKWSAG